MFCGWTTVQRERIVALSWQHYILLYGRVTLTPTIIKREGTVAFLWQEWLRERARM